MDKFMECSQLDCLLMGAIIVLVLCLVFNPMEKFDTSIATRSQVGDATNLDTLNGQGGFLPGNVYDCNSPILMVEPDNAWTWGDSKSYIADASLINLPGQYESMSDKEKEIRRNKAAAMARNNAQPVFLKQGFSNNDPSVQFQVFNKSRDVRGRSLGKEGFAEHLRRTNEGFDGERNSESTLAAVMQGYSPTSVVPQAVVQRLEKMPFTSEGLRGGQTGKM